jgi:hypothetical protein
MDVIAAGLQVVHGQLVTLAPGRRRGGVMTGPLVDLK